MRWEAQRTQRQQGPEAARDAAQQMLPGMPLPPGLLDGFQRSVRPPEFAGVTFHEVHAKSVLNKVPARSAVPFRYTINPYRGCSHACVYCFARSTHSYLEFDSGRDFDSQIVVKTNAAQVLRRELNKPGWQREHVAMGTNTDPYQRAEGRYALLPGIIEALADSGTPFSILTKGTVLARDLPLLSRAAQQVPVGIGISLALLDPELQRVLEPGTPTPKARLQLIGKIRDAGLPCGVFMAPLLPELSDGAEQIEALVRQLVDAGATGISGISLHLRPGAREWFMAWLARRHPELVGRYTELYAGGSYLPKSYRNQVQARIGAARRVVGAGRFSNPLPDRPAVATGVPGDSSARFPDGSLPPRRTGGSGRVDGADTPGGSPGVEEQLRLI